MMKNRNAIAVLLAAALILSLCGTGISTEKAFAEGYGYTTEEQVIWEGRNPLHPLVRSGNGIYCTVSELAGQRQSNPGEIPAYEGQLDIYRECLCLVSENGTVTRLEQYDPEFNVEPEASSNAAAPEISISAASAAPDGSLIFVYKVYELWSNAGEDVPMYSEDWYDACESAERFFIRVLSPEGKELSLHRIAWNQDYGYIHGMVWLNDTSVLMAIDDTVCRVGLDGTVDPAVEYDRWIDSMREIDDARVGVLYFGDTRKMDILDRRTLNVIGTLSLGRDANGLISGRDDYMVCFSTGTALAGYNARTGQSEEIVRWLDVNLDTSFIYGCFADADGGFTVLTGEWDSGRELCTTRLVRILHVPVSSLPEQQRLTLATLYLSTTMKEAVLSFNRTHSDVRIDVVEYNTYNTDADRTAGRTRLTAEVLAGQMPDLLVLNSLPAGQITAAGLLEDLDPYLDSDPELDRSDYFENILSAMSADGKLFRIIPSFTIMTMAGAKNIVGDRTGWTYEEVLEALGRLPDGAKLMDDYTTREEMLESLLGVSMNELVDRSTGSCSFNTPEFVRMLKFAGNFRSEDDWSLIEWNEGESEIDRITAGKQLLTKAYIQSSVDMILYGHEFGGEDRYSMIGYPTASGTSGSRFTTYDGEISMSSSCANKQAAWEFIRFFLTEEYQTELLNGMPIHRGAFERMLQRDMTPDYAADADGNRILMENGAYAMWSKVTFYENGEEVDVYAVTPEQAQALLRLVESMDRFQIEDENLTRIVQEQAAAFFSGQMSAEETAARIENQVTIYLNEQR